MITRLHSVFEKYLFISIVISVNDERIHEEFGKAMQRIFAFIELEILLRYDIL